VTARTLAVILGLAMAAPLAAQAYSAGLLDDTPGELETSARVAPVTFPRVNPPRPMPPVRITTTTTTTTTTTAAPLSACDEMHRYRIAAGLPAIFDQLGWRESRCLNTVTSRTGCCVGYWQLFVTLHLRDPRVAPRYALCGVRSAADVIGDDRRAKRRQACAAKALLDVAGIGAWSL